MSIDIYAGKKYSDGSWGPVTPFEAQTRTAWVEDEDGLGAHQIANPLYKPNSGLSTSSGDGYSLLDRLGLDTDPEADAISGFEIQVAIDAVAVHLTRGAADALAVRFLMLAIAGRERGATHILVG